MSAQSTSPIGLDCFRRRRLIGAGLAVTGLALLGQDPASAQGQLDIWLEDESLDTFSDPLRTIRRNLVLDVDHLRHGDMPGLADWRQNLGPISALQGRARFAAVNDFVNGRIDYLEDWENYGVRDHWALLSETVQRGAGDCEDSAIAKLETLAYLGQDPMHLALLVGFLAFPDGHTVPHAVAGVFEESRPHDPWILGNVDPNLSTLSERTDFTAHYAAIVVEDAPEWLVRHFAP